MRVFLFSILIVLVSKISFSQGTNCGNADPFCTGTNYQFQNNVNVSSASGADYGCLQTYPNQAWYYMKIATGGNIDIGIKQTTGANGTGSGIDVDFILYGPFSSPTGGCGQLDANHIVDCSYSTAATETANITNAVAGQYYILLLTNYSNTAGYIQFSQTGGGGSTDCSILCPLGQGGVTTPTAALTCTSAPVSIFADQSALPASQAITPCLMFQVPLTDNSGKNILEVYEGGTLLGCFRPTTSASSCSPNAGTIPNGNKWEAYASFLDPTLPHTFKFCEDNSNSTSGNMSYKVFDCYNTNGAPIASGTWVVNNGMAYPGSCQSVVINPGSGAGQWNFTGSSSFTGPGITTTNWGAASFNPVTAGPGTHVVTYNWNNGQTGTSLCSGTKTIAVTVGNPFNAAFTTPGPFCLTSSCATLTPLNNYGIGTNGWSGLGLTGNIFCPSSSGVGLIPITYSVGTSALCRSTVTNSVIVNSAPVAGAIASTSLTCTNNIVNITGSGGGNYSWSGPGIVSGGSTSTPGVNLTGIYTVTVTAANSCTSTATATVVQNITTPSANAGSTQTLICGAPSVTLTGTASPVGSTINWFGGICGPTNSLTTTACAPGSYTLEVIHPVSGCKNTSVVSVVSSTNVPQASVNATTNSITCTNSVVSIGVTLTSVDPVTYAWAGPGISGSNNNATTTATLSGVYSVTITNISSNCKVILNTTVFNNTNVVSSAIAASASITCATNTVTLNASPTGSNYNYNWSGPGTILNGSTSNPIVNVGGVYVVTMTNTINGCIGTASVTVPTNLVLPVVILSNNSYTLSCTNNSVTLNASSSIDPNSSYAWNVSPSGSLSSTTIHNPIATSAGFYSVAVTNTINGCVSAISTVTVTESLNTPTVNLSSTSIFITCLNTTPSVTLSTSTSQLSYSWTPTSGIVPGTETTANPVFNAAGSYSVVITNTTNGCATLSNANVVNVTRDDTSPNAIINALTTNTILGCGANNSTVILNSSNTTSSNGFQLIWLPGATTSPTLGVTTTGVYTLQVVDAVNGCSATAQYTVSGNTTAPQGVNAGAMVTMACGSSTVALTGTTTTSNTSFSWTGPTPTSIISGSNTSSPIVGQVGIYTLTVTDNLTGCSSTATVNVNQDNITASFTADPKSGLSPLTVNFTDTSIGALTYSWTFGDGNTSSSQNPSNIFVNSGSFVVTLIATKGNCTDTFKVEIVVSDGLMLEIPNVFTPNNDGHNDIFTIKSSGVKEISLQIFNRWGQKLYEFSGPQASWDGSTPQGLKVPEGTYFYFVKATGFDDKIIEKNGTVTLFR